MELPKLAEGSEHLVLFDEARANVLKVTRPLTFGESYFLKGGKVHQQNCSPVEYLLRLRLWQKLFGVAPRDLGITDGNQIVSIQPFVTGVPPSQDEVDNFLLASGLVPVKRNCWLWKRKYPQFEIWVGDARDENFLRTGTGIVPIDLRVWFANRAD